MALDKTFPSVKKCARKSAALVAVVAVISSALVPLFLLSDGACGQDLSEVKYDLRFSDPTGDVFVYSGTFSSAEMNATDLVGVNSSIDACSSIYFTWTLPTPLPDPSSMPSDWLLNYMMYIDTDGDREAEYEVSVTITGGSVVSYVSSSDDSWQTETATDVNGTDITTVLQSLPETPVFWNIYGSSSLINSTTNAVGYDTCPDEGFVLYGNLNPSIDITPLKPVEGEALKDDSTFVFSAESTTAVWMGVMMPDFDGDYYDMTYNETSGAWEYSYDLYTGETGDFTVSFMALASNGDFNYNNVTVHVNASSAPLVLNTSISVTITKPAEGETITLNETYYIYYNATGTASPAGAVEYVQWKIANTPYMDWTDADYGSSSGTWSVLVPLPPSSLDLIPPGEYTLEVRAIAGDSYNVAVVNFTIDVPGGGGQTGTSEEDEEETVPPSQETPTNTTLTVSVTEASMVFVWADAGHTKINSTIVIRGTSSGAKFVAVGLEYHYKNGTVRFSGWITPEMFSQQHPENGFNLTGNALPPGYTDYHLLPTGDNWTTWEFVAKGTIDRDSVVESDSGDENVSEIDHIEVYARAYAWDGTWNQGHTTATVSGDAGDEMLGKEVSQPSSGGFPLLLVIGIVVGVVAVLVGLGLWWIKRNR